MSNVIGIDTNTHGFHWVSTFGIGPKSDAGEKYGWLECQDKDVNVRRVETVEYAWGLFHTIRSDTVSIGKDREIHVFCEEPLALQNGKTTRLLGLAAGAIFGAFVCSGINAYWHWVDQSSWKKAILGRGVRPRDFVSDWPKAKQEKAWIVETCRGLPGFRAEEDPVRTLDFDAHLDLYDAWAIRTYGVRVIA
jgi:hypothetical protein